MRKWLNKYFSFSKSEFNGLIVMIVLLALIRAVPALYAFLVPEQFDVKAEQGALKRLMLTEENNKEMAWRRHTPDHMPVTTRLFRFDPNHTTIKDWQLLGLSEKQAAVMIRYTSRGGKFRRKEDLQKMYPISPLMYKKLESYITIRDTFTYTAKYAKRKFSPRAAVTVSLNTADTLTLDQVKGIGPAFARRIVKYRERLGGFYRKEQLMEVFGMDSLIYAEIKDQLVVDQAPLRMIYINRVEYAGLKDHPYLKYKQINAIIQYRKQHGNYGNIADLKKVLILSPETVDKLAPYISFEND